MTSMAESREFPFNAEHFRLISERMYAFSGIRLPEAKRRAILELLAEGQLSRRAIGRKLGVSHEIVRLIGKAEAS